MPQTAPDTNPDSAKRFQCRHIFTDGRRCGSACLRHEEFCYYHHTTRRPVENPRQRRSRRSTFDLPLPEDRSAIQSSIGQVLRRIASNEIDPRRAGLLLYGLQIASLNLPRDPASSRKDAPPVPETVEEVTIDPALGPLAPRAEVGKTQRRLSVVGALLQRLSEESNNDAASSKLEQDQQAAPTILPAIRAEAQPASHVEPPTCDQPKLALRRAHHYQRRQVFLNLVSPEKQLVEAMQRVLLEVVRSVQHTPANFNRRISLGASKNTQHSLRSKVRLASLGLDDALGDEKQLRPRFKRLDRRFIRRMCEQTHRHSDIWQRARPPRIAKCRSQSTSVDISKQAKRQIVRANKSRRELYTVGCSNQCMVDDLHQLGRAIHQVRIARLEELGATLAKSLLHRSRDRLCLFLSARNIGQQHDHMRAKIDCIEEVAARAR